MPLTLATCVAVPRGAWANAQKTRVRLLGGPQRLGLTVIMEVCKTNFHTVMQLQYKVCALMAYRGRGKEHIVS